MSNANDLASRTLSIQRTFNAPIELVWEAWTNPEHIAKWWGPQGMKTKIVKHDFKVGGEWEYVMTMLDGNDFIAAGTYHEIVPIEKIVTSADFRPMTTGVELQILLKAIDGKTEFTFNCVHATIEYKMQQEKMGFFKGWGSTFDRLEAMFNK